MESTKPILGKYRIIKEIARSGNVVYEGLDPAMGRRIAIKELLLPDNVSELQKQDRITRFLKEAKVAGALAHPNIVAIHDVGEDNRRYFIVMEYLEGETLRSSLKNNGALPANKTIPIVLQLCDALGYAHSRGVIHRDIKPENVYLQPRGLVKLTDFGLARVQDETGLTSEGHIVGTPYYMSPEQISGKTVDRRSDIFSLGVLLFELLTGVRPFKGESIAEIAQKIISFSPPMPEGVSPALQTVLQRALAKDVNMRYQTVAQMTNDLKAARESVGTNAVGTGGSFVYANPPSGAPMPIQPPPAPAAAPNYAGNHPQPAGPIASPSPGPNKNPLVKVLIALIVLMIVVLGAADYMAIKSGSLQSADMVYNGGLAPGWQNWSYKSKVDFSNTSPVHEDDYSIAVKITQPYGALEFHNEKLDTGKYQSVSFWINGGPKGFPTPVLQGVIQDTKRGPQYPLASISPNTWVQEVVPLKMIGLVPGSNSTGFWIQDTSGTTGQVFYVDDVELVRS